MAELTANYSLAKQQGNEYIDIAGLNENFDIVDSEIKKANDKADSAFQSANSGKENIKTAIGTKDPSVIIPTDATFSQLATCISQIETGVDTSDATAIASQILADMTAYVNEVKLLGTMPNRGAITKSLAINETYTIPQGYHNGSGKVAQAITIKGAQTYTPSAINQTITSGQYLSGVQTILGDADLIASKLPSDVNLFGVQGSRSLGKNFASGTVTSSSSTSIFFNDELVQKSMFSVSVNVLNFKPSLIFVFSSELSGTYPTIYNENGVTYNSSRNIKCVMYTSFFSEQNIIVNGSGFYLPCVNGNKIFNWMAFE